MSERKKTGRRETRDLLNARAKVRVKSGLSRRHVALNLMPKLPKRGITKPHNGKYSRLALRLALAAKKSFLQRITQKRVELDAKKQPPEEK